MSALSTVERRRLWREAASLSRGRLVRTRGARLGRALAWALLAGFAAAAVAARYGDRGPVDLSGFGPSAARFAAWMAAGPIALSAANGRERSDRVDGIDALASSFGVGASALRAGRLLGVVLACTRVIALPSIGVALLVAGLAGSMADAASALRTVPVLALFAVVGGSVLGALALIAERVSPERGMRTFGLLIVVPWAVSGLVDWSGASVPGALDALLTTALALTGATGT